MSRIKKRIKIKKEKVILTDVLPYEMPVTFSNKYFYSFLLTNSIKITGDIISWNKNDASLELIIKLLFGFKNDKNSNNQEIKIGFKKQEHRTIPYRYKISHKENDFRELVIIHPKNQLMLIEFYDNYKDLILYYCKISPFSIRRPHKIAKFTYYKDRTHIENLAHDHEHQSVEEFNREYETLKTFFSYKEISNIYKFYESYDYHRCEKKYNKLLKFDISKCFDSIYSHSLSWALLNKDIVKDNTQLSNETFGGKFDLLMQSLNFGETNGIIIGPEFSRIFAEIILQRIDLNVMNYLRNKNNKEISLKFKKDYEIFRYVDDFFVFYNDDHTIERILSAYRSQLMEYKLYINDAKSAPFEKPIITEITIAKQKIADLLKEHLTIKVSEDKQILQDEANEEQEKKEKKYSFYASSNRLITRFKTIIKETAIEYKDILNYTLACIDRKTLKLINEYSMIEPENKNKNEFKAVKYILELLDFTFFIYSVFPRVNTTIKLCLILSNITKFAKIKGNFNHDNQHLIFKKMYDEISLVLERTKNIEYTQIETLYLLIALKELGKEYRLDESVLCKYFSIDIDKEKCNYDLNYFSITILLFYIENKKRYNKLKEVLKKHVLFKFDDSNKLRMAEMTFLLFDLLSCPWVDESFKTNLLIQYDIKNLSDQRAILNRKQLWFTKWTDFDFCKALESKKSLEVY